MLSKLTYGYLILTTAAPVASLFTDYTPTTITAVFALAQVVALPLFSRCARKVGWKAGWDAGHIQGFIEGRDAAYAEIRSIAMKSIERAAQR